MGNYDHIPYDKLVEDLDRATREVDSLCGLPDTKKNIELFDAKAQREEDLNLAVFQRLHDVPGLLEQKIAEARIMQPGEAERALEILENLRKKLGYNSE